MKHIFFLILFLSSYATSFAEPFLFSNTSGSRTGIPGTYFQLLEDTSNHLTINEVAQSRGFVNVLQVIPNLGISKSSFWFKGAIKNGSPENNILLVLEQPMVDEAELYLRNRDGSLTVTKFGKNIPFYSRPFPYVDYIFRIDAVPGETKEFFLKVRSAAQIVLPFKAGTADEVEKVAVYKELLFGLYAGIILVMALYNLFVFFTVRDRSYLLYVFYILFIGLTQTTLQGYTFKYLWPNSSMLAEQSINLTSCLVGIAALEFIKEFLKTKEFTPRLHKVIHVFTGLFIVSIILSMVGKRTDSFQLMQADTGIASIFALFISYRIYKLNYRPAGFFLLSWSILLVGAIVFVLKDVGVVPYNPLSIYAIQIASVAEVILLSFALADKINIFRKEKEESQAQTVRALQENERIISEQNVILEGKVTERTYELKLSNDGLNKAMTELKETQTQLVESEKMASLGQLTAGIAHEINNPINFVTSNVKPLNRDVKILLETVAAIEQIVLDDEPVAAKKKRIAEYKTDIDYDYLKMEIDQLLAGIGDGASRTAEIVKGLRIFSRLDEDDLKKADINEGLESTLVISNNMLNNKIKVKKDLGNLPMVECYPGKLNQVFLNMISNAVYAINKKFGDKEGGLLTIATHHDDKNVFISIADNGTGMDENTRKRLFEPFFTTKDVGEGTGLGMSISYNTINKHNGRMQVNSEPGVGTEFIITLPLIQK